MMHGGVHTNRAGRGKPSHRASVICSGNDIRSRSSDLNKCGGIVNSGLVGQCANAAPALRPECERRCARRAAVRPDNMVPSLKYESEMEEDQHCQPCRHSPGSPSACVSGRLPARRSGQLGLHQNPSLSSLSVALLSSPRHSSTGSSRLDIDSTVGFLFPIMCNASAHEAQ